MNNLPACGAVDVCLGGPGLLWIDVFLVSVILFIVGRAYKTKEGKWAAGLAIAFFATQFMVPGGYFYRYVSYIYLIPVFLLLATECLNVGRKVQVGRKIVYSLLLVNSLVAMGATLSTTLVANQIEDYYVKCINASDKPCYSSHLYGFVSKIDPSKQSLGTAKPTKAMEQIPLLPTRVTIYLDYEALNRNVPTTFVQDLLLKKGVLK